MYFHIATHSVNALKGIMVSSGVVDRDYRGDIGIILHNTSQQPFQVTQGQKIAQGIFEKLSTPQIVITETLSTMSRNNSSFSSTDKSNQKRVQICKFDQDNVYQIDRTRGPGKIRVRHMPTSIRQHPIINPAPVPQVTKEQISETCTPTSATVNPNVS